MGQHHNAPGGPYRPVVKTQKNPVKTERAHGVMPYPKFLQHRVILALAVNLGFGGFITRFDALTYLLYGLVAGLSVLYAAWAVGVHMYRKGFIAGEMVGHSDGLLNRPKFFPQREAE